MITVLGRKRLKIEHFRPELVIMAPQPASTRPSKDQMGVIPLEGVADRGAVGRLWPEPW
jgi:hypothetical protein